jgi:hypothetical protein
VHTLAAIPTSDRLTSPLLGEQGNPAEAPQPSLKNGIVSSHCDYDNSTSNREAPCPISGNNPMDMDGRAF